MSGHRGVDQLWQLVNPRVQTILRNPSLFVASFGLVVIVTCAVFAPTIVPADPLKQNIARRLLPPAWEPLGSPTNLLGTDEVGRDEFTRILYGARVSLVLAFASVSISAVLGTSLGLVAGWAAGWISTVLLRLTDVQLAFPFLALAITVIALFGSSLVDLVLVLVLWSWPQFMRVARAEVLSHKQREYVLAARSVGASGVRILGYHILRNIAPSLVVVWTITVAQMVLAESALSFLGFGVPPPEPTWGGMLANGRAHISTAWWLVTFPGLGIMLTVLCVNGIGDSLSKSLSGAARQTTL